MTNDSKIPVFHTEKQINEFLQNVLLTSQHVLKYLRKLNKNSAAGPDGLPGYFWYSLRHSINGSLTYIYNKSLAEGNLPTLWKKSIITLCFQERRSYSLWKLPLSHFDKHCLQNNGIYFMR